MKQADVQAGEDLTSKSPGVGKGRSGYQELLILLSSKSVVLSWALQS